MKKFIENYLMMIIGLLLSIWAICLADNIIEVSVMVIFAFSFVGITLTDISEAKQK